MAYTRPSASAADASWLGDPIYTRPGADSAHAVFSSDTYIATGIAVASFGTASALLTQPVTGLAATSFGTPNGVAVQPVSGFAPVSFGSARLFPYHVAPWTAITFGDITVHRSALVSGWDLTTFGEPSGTQFFDVTSLGKVATFGTPTTPTNRTGEASGFAVTSFGSPLAFRYSPTAPLNRYAYVHGTLHVSFGQPSAGWLQTGVASGFAPVSMGEPTAEETGSVTGLDAASFGTPLAVQTQEVDGWNPVSFGTPVGRRVQPVSGWVLNVLYGLPEAERSNTYEVYGFRAWRFGHPTGFSRFNYTPEGFAPVSLGVPQSKETHRVRGLVVSAQFGTPLLIRNTSC